MSPAAPLPTTAPERSLWHERQLWKLALAGFCFGGVQYSFTTYLALFLSERWGVSSLFAARLLAQAHVGAIVSRVPYGWLSDRWRGGDCKAVLQGLSAVALGLLLLLLLLPPRLPLLLLSAIILLYGLSGLAWGGLYQTVAVEFSSPERAGVSAGIATTLLHLGNCAMAPVFGYLVDMTGSYTTAWGLLMLAQLLGIVLLGWVQPAPVPRQVMAASGVMKELHVCPKRDTNGVHVNGFRRPSRLALVAGIAAFGLLGAEIALHSSLTSRKLSEDTTRVVSRPLPPLPQGPALREAPKSVQWAQTTLSYQLPTGEPLTVPLPPLHHTPEDVPATVTLDASDSTPLWLTFDPETLALSGTAPPTETGKTYHLTFRAYTAHGLASPLHLALTLIAQSRPSLALPLKASGQRQSLTPVEEKCLLEKLQGNPCEDN